MKISDIPNGSQLITDSQDVEESDEIDEIDEINIWELVEMNGYDKRMIHKNKDMWKHVSVSGISLSIVIKNVSPEIAIPEMEAAGNVHLIAVNDGWVQGEITFKSASDAIARAKELVANGWNWGWD